MPEVVDEGLTGFVVTSAEEAVGAVVRAAALDRQTCRTVALQRFSSHRMVRDYLEVYDRVLSAAWK